MNIFRPASVPRYTTRRHATHCFDAPPIDFPRKSPQFSRRPIGNPATFHRDAAALFARVSRADIPLPSIRFPRHPSAAPMTFKFAVGVACAIRREKSIEQLGIEALIMAKRVDTAADRFFAERKTSYSLTAWPIVFHRDVSSRFRRPPPHTRTKTNEICY